MDINPRNQPTSRKSDDAGHLVPSSISSHENIVSDPAMLERVPGSGHKPAQKPAQKPDDSKVSVTPPQDTILEDWEKDRNFHLSLFSGGGATAHAKAQDARLEEITTTPLFSANVLLATLKAGGRTSKKEMFPSFGLLAEHQETYGHDIPAITSGVTDESAAEDNRLFLNTNAPWSAFICGAQGTGKSHTLSCILEDALLQDTGLGRLPNKLAGMVFHYDKFTGLSSSQKCEAAYLCSMGIPVNVLVSPPSYLKMRKLYKKLDGLPAGVGPNVAPLFLEPKHLNVERMMKLMAMDNKEGGVPLYMEVLCKILREMGLNEDGASGFDYKDFQKRLAVEDFNPTQAAMIKLRLELLENFLEPTNIPKTAKPQNEPKHVDTAAGKRATRAWYYNKDQLRRAKIAQREIWSFSPGSLTIVDLSCPFVDEGAACTLFNMCLSIFLDGRTDEPVDARKDGSKGKRKDEEKGEPKEISRIIALDEAHKFMSEDPNASTLTQTLLSVIRQQRHLATRVVIATQEPTISPKLLDLCSMTIVHRFPSPDWLKTIQAHLAGASYVDEEELFKMIAALPTGEALLFSPTAILGVDVSTDASGSCILKGQRLGMGYLKIGIRKRLTADGGRSQTAN